MNPNPEFERKLNEMCEKGGIDPKLVKPDQTIPLSENPLLETFKEKVKYLSEKHQIPCAVVVVLPMEGGLMKTTVFGEDRILKMVRDALGNLHEKSQQSPSTN